MLENVMFSKKKFFLIFCLVLFFSNTSASEKQKVIQNLKNINTIKFQFEQNINGKIENGICSLSYPKKIYCKYNLKNNKILVSNGRSLVIKTSNSYYLYPIEKTSLNFILDKKFILEKIASIKERIVDDKFINFNFLADENEISIFFDRKTYNLIGWQTFDLYQNLSITYLFSIIKNPIINDNIFKLPEQNN